MGEHFTLRLPAATAQRLERRARLADMKPRSLAARYIEEGIRRDDHPLVHFVDGPTGRRARLVGTRLDVWLVIETLRLNANDLGETAEHLSVGRWMVDAAVAYYAEFRQEIDERIALNSAEAQRGQAAARAARQALSG